MIGLLQVCDNFPDGSEKSNPELVIKEAEDDQRLILQMKQAGVSSNIQKQPLVLLKSYCGGQFLSSPLIQIMTILLVIFVIIISLGVRECPIIRL